MRLDLHDGDSRLELPDGLRSAITAQLRTLSEECRTLLQAAAVIGRDFEAELLASTTGHSLDHTMSILDEACAAQLLTDHGAPVVYRFVHVLASLRAKEYDLLQFNRLLLATVKLESGDGHGVRKEIRLFEEVALRLKQPQALWMVQGFRATLALLEGRLAEVEKNTIHCLVAGQRIRDNTALQTFGVQLTFLRAEQDRALEVLASVREYQESYPRVRAWRLLNGFLSALAGDHRTARVVLDELANSNFDLRRDLVWLPALCFAAETCAMLREVACARAVYGLLTPFADKICVAGFGSVCLGSVHRYLGLLAATFSDTDLALHHLEQALRSNAAIGAALLRAHTERELAEVLSARNEQHARQRMLLSSALDTARGLGLALLQRRILAMESVP